MTMFGKFGTAAAAGLVALLFGGQQARAGDDTIRLGGNIGAKTTTLSFDGKSETTLMRGAHGFAGHRGGYGGHGGFYRASFHGYGHGHGHFNYRPYYASYYRPYYGSYYSSYYPYYSSYYPYYASYGYAAPYYQYCAPSAYYSPSYAYYPISAGVTYGQPAGAYGAAPPTSQVLPMPQQYNQNVVPMPPAGSYPYDGGPVNPVPLPKGGDGVKGVITTGETRLVMLSPAQKLATQSTNASFAYPAYGENLQATTFATTRTTPATATTKRN